MYFKLFDSELMELASESMATKDCLKKKKKAKLFSYSPSGKLDAKKIKILWITLWGCPMHWEAKDWDDLEKQKRG